MRKHLPLLFSLLAACILRIGWRLYTGFTYEDAFITFRYARNLANGLGFVYNPPEHIYGTTTPLFTILLAIWTRIFPNQIIPGASIFGLLSGLIAIGLVWKLLEENTINKTQGYLAIGALVLSDKFWSRDMGGMETSLVICAMMACYYLLVRNKPAWAGLFAGILLWTRIDGIFWITVLVLVTWYVTRRFPAKFILIALLVYLPWLVFAALYFGSPVPYTITAKLVAYYQFGSPPVLERIQTILNWLTPISLPNLPQNLLQWVATITIIFAFFGALACGRSKPLLVLPVFVVEEIVRLVVMAETFEPRYFIPFFWCFSILFGFGVYAAWDELSRRFKLKPMLAFSTVTIYVVVSLWFTWQTAQLKKDDQDFLYDASLKQIGLWLQKNTPTSASVFLEPLGYVGFYSNRYMIDDVGLVSPKVVALKNAGYSSLDEIKFLEPDYVILHCDDSNRESDVFLARYSRAAEFNPLSFDPASPMNYDPEASQAARLILVRPRTACYQVWKK